MSEPIELPQAAPMREYQRYVHALEAMHGWLDVDLVHNCFLMGEEVGELFKAIRKLLAIYEQSGAAPSAEEERRAHVADEIVDVLNYLLAIANRLDIDVEEAFRRKNAENQRRSWGPEAAPSTRPARARMLIRTAALVLRPDPVQQRAPMQLRNVAQRAVGRAPSAPEGLRAPPQLSGGLPLVGHTVEFVRSTIELLFRAHRELGEVAGFRVFHRDMVALFGPDAHEAVFRAPDAVLSPTEAYKIMTPVFGKDVVYDASPEKMAEQLKMLLPALKDRRMRTYGEAVVLETEDTVRGWGQSGVVDFVEFCRVLTNFTSSRCLLGKEFREGMSEEFAAVYHDLEGGVTPLAYINAHLPCPPSAAATRRACGWSR
ncbi:MAG: cytochrome P450 [Sandaracinaceae bacterium]|nr:cytochrome P450 [Sandaracinaceae bacterium]